MDNRQIHTFTRERMRGILLIFTTLSLCVNLAFAESPKEAKPSFDCAKATTKVEKMICSDESGDLQNLDRYMSEVYTQLRQELRKSRFKDKEQRLSMLLETQRKFIRKTQQITKKDSDVLYNLKVSYEKQTINLLRTLGEVLDSNNKELCQYAKKWKSDMSGWEKIPPSANPPFSIGLCAFGRNNRDVFLETFCTEGEAKKEEFEQAVREDSPYIHFPESYERKIDINNDGKLEHLILSQGSFFGVLWIYKDGKIDKKASDRIYGDDLHFSGGKTQ